MKMPGSVMHGGDHKLMPLEIVQVSEAKIGPGGNALVFCVDYPGEHNEDENTHKRDIVILN